VFITVSSGIGGGIVLDGRLLQGARGLAGSLGQTLGRRGGERLETRASGFGLASSAAAQGHAATTHEIFAAGDQGLPWAVALLDEAVEDLAVALGDLQRLIDPQLVVLGGGVGMLPQFRERLVARLRQEPARLRTEISPAALGGDAGIIGIADWCSAA
jgi:N-acetylmannosamine-6-phosphate 2-epimerase/N-acetylmannosamine kinase